MISRQSTVWPAAVRWSITVCPPVSVSSVRLSLTVITAQRTDGGLWASCCLCVAVITAENLRLMTDRLYTARERRDRQARLIIVSNSHAVTHRLVSLQRKFGD